jgi:hypothetical protein
MDWSASGQGEVSAGNFYIYRAPRNAMNLLISCGKIGFQEGFSCMKLFGKLYWNYDKAQQYDEQRSPYMPACGSFIATSWQGLSLRYKKMNQDGQTTYFLGAVLLLATQILSKIQPS